MRLQVGLSLLILAVSFAIVIFASNRGYARKKTVEEVQRQNDELKTLVRALHNTAVRSEHSEPLLADEVQQRIATHPIFQEELSKELDS